MANTKRVWLFEEGNATMRDELGGKGAKPLRNDQHRPAGASRLHDYDRYVQ